MRMMLLAALMMTIGCAPNAQGETLRLESGNDRVHLLELFTSEGCSSCPPADRWLTTLREDPRLWRQVVPVAFHVDYWNYLGWDDRFARPDHSRRQRELAAAGRFQVYTPGFVLDGREWRRGLLDRKLTLTTGERPGNLVIEVDRDRVRLRFTPSERSARDLEAHVVQLAFDQQTRVTAGENRRKTLNHDFVVLTHSLAALSLSAGGLSGELRLPYAVEATALAAWVSRAGDLHPIQATGGWLDNAEFGTRFNPAASR